MASPIIDSVSPAGPLTLAPGQSVTFNVAAHDPDTRSGSATFVVTDAANNATPVVVNLTVADTLTFSATTTVGTITPDPTVPGRFLLTV
jgi:hypothetical protein